MGDRPAIGLRSEHTDVRRDELQAVGAQVEIPNDRRPQPPDGVGQPRHPNAVERRRLGRAADVTAPFEDERPPARLREVRGRNQGVVTAADDGDVVLVRHRSGSLPAAGPEDLHCRDPAVRAHDPAARVRRRTAQPQIADRHE